MERREVNVVEAADIDHHCRLAIFVGTTRERLGAADLAEEMRDALGIEAVFGERVFAREESKLLSGDKCQYEAFLLAVRTIARHRMREVRLDFIPHGFAMASSCVFHKGIV